AAPAAAPPLGEPQPAPLVEAPREQKQPDQPPELKAQPPAAAPPPQPAAAPAAEEKAAPQAEQEPQPEQPRPVRRTSWLPLMIFGGVALSLVAGLFLVFGRNRRPPEP